MGGQRFPTKILGMGLALCFTAAFALGFSQQQQQTPPEQEQQQRPRAESRQQRERQPQRQMGEWIPITSANELVGRTVVNEQGENLGEVEYVLIDLESGQLRYAVLASGGALDIGNELVAVPWPAFELRSGQKLTLDATREKLQQAPRIAEERISELTEPTMTTRVYDYYVVPQEETTRRSQEQRTPEQQRPEQHQHQPEQQQPEQQQPEQQQPEQQQPEQQQTPPAREQQQRPQAQTERGGERRAILIGREFVTVLSPPQLVSANEMSGTNVVTQDGDDVGEIDQILLDIDRGRIAYVLVSRGGYLGMGERWVPVPFEALEFSTEDNNYVLQVPTQELEQMQALEKEDLPTRVRRDDLQKLYRDFGVQPYWRETRVSE